MKIKLHENAKKDFNERMKEFLYELKPDKTKKQKHVKIESSASHAFVSGNFTDKEIINISSKGYIDNLSGKQIARYFIADNTPIGLGQESYSAFVKVAETFHRRKEISPLLSLEFIIDCTFEWFEYMYKGLVSADKDFVDFLVQKAEKAIKKLKVSIPISFLSIEKPFKIGNITFEYFKTEFFNSYINHFKSKAQKSEGFNIFERNFRNRYQGMVFASISLEAEQERCIEIARFETERALMVLRFFSPSTFIPIIPCYFGIMGQTDIPKSYVFIFENEIPTVDEGTADRRKYVWPISHKGFEELKKLGIGIASDLIRKQNPSEFENLIINSMSLFGKSLTSNNYQDKIVYLLISIETSLLLNQSEPIQSNVGLRLSFLTESEPKKRKAVKALINEAYKIRSSYIHHGKIVEDWELLKRLQHVIWTAIKNMLINKDKFKTQKNFLDYVEKLILT
jgi:hypothetical protein